MPEETDSGRTRRSLLAAVGGGSSLLAGCNVFDNSDAPNGEFPRSDTDGDTTATGGDGTTAATTAGSGAERPGETVVTEGERLGAALANSGLVRISGRVELSSSVRVPEGTTLYGWGRWHVGGHRAHGDVVVGDFEGPVVDIDSKGTVQGLAVVNEHDAGEAISLLGHKPFVRMVDAVANRKGIADGRDSRAIGTWLLENRAIIHHVSPDDPLGEVGIETTSHTDAEIHHNTVRGYDVLMGIRGGGTTATNNHVYPHPVSRSDTPAVGIETVRGSSWILNNYVDTARVGIRLRHGWANIVAHNKLSVTRDGVRYELSGESTDINFNEVRNNQIFMKHASEARTPVRGENVGAVQGSSIADNNYMGQFTEIDRHLTTAHQGTVTKSGDGSTTVFALPHRVAGTPTDVQVTPTAADAAGEYYLSAVTDTAVELTYTAAPPAGDANLSWRVSAADPRPPDWSTSY